MGLCSEWKALGRGCVISLNAFIIRREAKASVGEEAALIHVRQDREGLVTPVVWAEFLILSVLRHGRGVVLLS